MLRSKISRSSWLITVLVLGLVPLFNVRELNAYPLPSRSVRLESSQISINTLHVYSFNIPSNYLTGSIAFEYCANNPFLLAPCTAPVGLDVSGANLDSESGDVGYSIHPATSANRIVLTRPPLLSVTGPAQYVFSNVINPSSVGTVYVRITLHSSDDATGPYTDGGGVVLSITRQLSTQAFVPPFLIFCVGITVVPDCTSNNGNGVNFGELSKTNPNTATSQFSGFTNDESGFFTNIFASTMTAGNKVINPLTSASGSAPGTSQFGLNLRANSNPGVGQDPIGPGTQSIAPDYNVPNQFILKNGTVTSSPLPTEYKIFTVSYLVNVSPDQAPGIYNTTITYVATASF